MKQPTYLLILCLLSIETILAQDYTRHYGEFRNTAPLSSHDDHPLKDTVYIDIRVDHNGQEFLVLDNFTDTSIQSSSQSGQLEYQYEALNPLGAWQPIFRTGPGCGTGIGTYDLPANKYTWTNLRGNRFHGAYQTLIRYVVDVDDQRLVSAPVEAGIDPTDFAITRSWAHNHAFDATTDLTNKTLTAQEFRYLNIHLINLVQSGFVHEAWRTLEHQFVAIKDDSGKNYLQGLFLRMLMSDSLASILNRDARANFMVGICLFWNKVSKLEHLDFQDNADRFTEICSGRVNQSIELKSLYTTYENQLDRFIPEIVEPIIERYFEY